MSIMIPPRLAVAKAGPVGPGSGVLLTEFPLSTYGRITPQKKMQRAWALSFEVPWITLAEDAIGDRFSGVEWHLEDETDTEIDDAYIGPDAQAARALLEKPTAGLNLGAPFYRSDLWAITSRAMGVCGSAFIYLDQPEVLAGTPRAMIPIAPWRMFAEDDPQGNLIGWSIDRTPSDPGIPITLEQVLHYQLRRNFIGHFGVGNIEIAMRKAGISNGLDDHVNMVLSAGGRLSGILSPKAGTVGTDEILQMERDWRTIVDQSDAAKKLQLVRAPIQFDRTTLTPAELQVVDLMKNAKEELLTIWDVPLTSVGGSAPAGLNSGDTKKYDNQVIWQGPVHHRLGIFREVTQFQLLDRYSARGATVELELDEPEFEDDSPRYDLLGKSLNTPMRTVERRALIGLPPFGDPMLDNQILLPSTQVIFGQAPDEADESTIPALGPTGGVQMVASSTTPALLAAGEQAAPTGVTPQAKAVLPSRLGKRVAPLHASLVRYREHAQASFTPLLKTAVGDVLKAQRNDIVARLRKHADHLSLHPTDASIWFDKGWDTKLRKALAPRLEAVANVVNAQIHDVLPVQPAKAPPQGAVERVMSRGAARVTGINQTTRDKIQSAVSRGLEQGLSVLDVADLIESGGEVDGLSMGSVFDEYRAEMIARTELMDAYNASAIASYGDAGVTQVQAIDGDGDEECAARDGQTFDIEEADAIEDHPNGTLDWVPIVDEAKATAPQVASVAPQSLYLQPTINVTMPEIRSDAHIYVPDQPPVSVTPQIDIHTSPPIVTVNTPQMKAADVNVVIPDTLHIGSMPSRVTERKVIRDRDGTLTRTEETERDG